MKNSDFILSAKQWINATKVDFNRLNIHQNTISSKQDQVCVFGNAELSSCFSFTFRINKISYFCIGIYGSMAKNDEMQNTGSETKILESQCQSMKEEKQIYIKFFNDGSVWVNDQKKKKIFKFKSENNVNVTGNLKQGAIEWKVNDQPSQSLHLQLLKNSKVRWAPYFCLWPNSQVTLISNFYDVPLFMACLASLWFDWDDDVFCELNLLLFDHS